MKSIAVAFALLAAAPAAAESFTGEWQSFTLLDDYRWDENRCAMALVLERRWVLQTRADAADQLFGTYVGALHGRVYRNETGSCRAPGQNGVNLFFGNMRFWQVEGFSSGGTARLQAKYSACEGDNCQDPTVTTEGFTARLALEGDALTAVDEAKADATPRVFHRAEWHQKRGEEAEAAFVELIGVLRDGTREDIKSRYSPVLSEAEKEAMLSALPIFRATTATIASRELVDVKVVDIPQVAANVHRLNKAALIIHQVNGRDGVKWLEIAFLHRQDDAWKLSGIYR